jgi:hypothetical protein
LRLRETETDRYIETQIYIYREIKRTKMTTERERGGGVRERGIERERDREANVTE